VPAMRANNTEKAQSPQAALAEGPTDDADAYVKYAVVVYAYSYSSDLTRVSLHNARQAHVEVEFHREWRKTISQIESQLKREAAVDPSSAPKAADLSEYRETSLELARRHVREGEARVTRQRKIIARMPPTAELSRTARRVLQGFERILRDHKDHLARLEGRGTA